VLATRRPIISGSSASRNLWPPPFLHGVCPAERWIGQAHQIEGIQFPAGPLIGDFTFTRKINGTIDFVDRDGTYCAILFRCSK
jgi:hypothetical protein